MTRPLAGSRRPREEVLHVDYADVLERALLNERLEVVRRISEKVDRVPLRDQTRGDSWNRPLRDAESVVRDIKRVIQEVAETR